MSTRRGPAVSNGELRSSLSQVLLTQASPEVLSSVPVRNPRLHRQQDGPGQLGREENAGQETRVHFVLTCMLATERPRRALLSLLLRASVSATPSGILTWYPLLPTTPSSKYTPFLPRKQHTATGGPMTCQSSTPKCRDATPGPRLPSFLPFSSATWTPPRTVSLRITWEAA